MGFVPGLRPMARPMGRFLYRANPSSTPCRAGPWPIKPTTIYFHQYFHQMLKHFIIFTNITINNIYVQVTTIPIVYFYRATTGSTIERVVPVPCHVPGWWPRRGLVPRAHGHRAVPCLGQAMGRATGPRAAWPCIDWTCIAIVKNVLQYPIFFFSRTKQDLGVKNICATFAYGYLISHAQLLMCIPQAWLS